MITLHLSLECEQEDLISKFVGGLSHKGDIQVEFRRIRRQLLCRNWTGGSQPLVDAIHRKGWVTNI
eukprot:7539149-Prorocentrum_lima.AAC.1